MSLLVSSVILNATQHNDFRHYRMAGHVTERMVDLRTIDICDEALQELRGILQDHGETKTCRSLDAIFLARVGNFDAPVPNFYAFYESLVAYLKKDVIDGWIYVQKPDGYLYPELVTSVIADVHTSRGKDTPTVTIKTIYYGMNGSRDAVHKMNVRSTSYSFEAQDVARRRMPDILAAKGLYKETAALKASFLSDIEHHNTQTRDTFAKQFRANGAVYQFEEYGYRRHAEKLDNRKVIHDLEAANYAPSSNFVESMILQDNEELDGIGAIPEHPVIRVFDLKTHEYLWINTRGLTRYEYDKSLGQKLILPDTHRELLDILTHDIAAYVDDIIEEKSAGNVILCKGRPGLGKTLTAEVYAELIEVPLLYVRAGMLGSDAKDIERNLNELFQRGKRWGCLILIDEADVFVLKRGNDLVQNAIVAVFNRALEYFDGLLMMTTNRPDDIDDAILSRCAAIIGYQYPDSKAAAKIWRVMAAQNKVEIEDALMAELLVTFPEIAPRDIKMLLRLVLRMVDRENRKMKIEDFRRCAVYRDIKIADV